MAAYITKADYVAVVKSGNLSTEDFDRLADIASDVIYDICRVKPTEADLQNEHFKKAVIYEVELLEAQGGVDAILGFSEASQAGSSESLGDYSVSSNPGAQQVITTKDGIPVSSLAIAQLRRMGLMSRWAYADVYRRR